MKAKNWTQRMAGEKARARNGSVEGIQDYPRSSEGGSGRGEEERRRERCPGHRRYFSKQPACAGCLRGVSRGLTASQPYRPFTTGNTFLCSKNHEHVYIDVWGKHKTNIYQTVAAPGKRERRLSLLGQWGQMGFLHPLQLTHTKVNRKRHPPTRIISWRC